MADFAIGFCAVRRVLLIFAGGAAAVIISVFAVIILLCAASITFNAITARLARRWRQRGHVPRNKFERIILDSAGRKDGTDG